MYQILHDLSITAPPSKIFEAFTEPMHLNNWWTKACEGAPQLNNVYRLYFAPAYDWTAKVSICIPNERFELKMTAAGADWSPTRFGIHLQQAEEETLVSFYHSNWQSTNHHYRRTSYCWALLLNLLKNYVERNEIVPFEQRA